MKIAVIIVGSHLAGKSKTINKYFKPLIGLKGRQRSFSKGRVFSQSQEEKKGRVLSQTLEEKKTRSVNAFIEKYSRFKYLVCAARPETESPSFYLSLKTSLEKSGFVVKTVRVEKNNDETYYETKAKEIHQHLEFV